MVFRYGRPAFHLSRSNPFNLLRLSPSSLLRLNPSNMETPRMAVDLLHRHCPIRISAEAGLAREQGSSHIRTNGSWGIWPGQGQTRPDWNTGGQEEATAGRLRATLGDSLRLPRATPAGYYRVNSQGRLPGDSRTTLGRFPGQLLRDS
eukprot:gene5239-biopygen2362